MLVVRRSSILYRMIERTAKFDHSRLSAAILAACFFWAGFKLLMWNRLCVSIRHGNIGRSGSDFWTKGLINDDGEGPRNSRAPVSEGFVVLLILCIYIPTEGTTVGLDERSSRIGSNQEVCLCTHHFKRRIRKSKISPKSEKFANVFISKSPVLLL